MILALYFIYERRADLIVLTASSFLFLICATDTLYSRIPNLANAVLILLGFCFHIHESGFAGAGWALLGMLAGLALFLVPFLLGGMGAGDVKALTALGTLLGPGIIFQVFIYTALFGGAMGALHALFAQNLRDKFLVFAGTLRAGGLTALRHFQFPTTSQTEPLRFPYAAALAFGFFAYIHWGGIMKLLAASNT
jgi:prepilin peptidase CpaA